MFLKIDFNSDEAIYIQLRNQIIMGIATDMIREGDTLPSVRQMADYIGINMHTVNKAYSVLRQEGFVKLDRRKGAVVSLDVDKMQAIDGMRGDLDVLETAGTWAAAVRPYIQACSEKRPGPCCAESAGTVLDINGGFVCYVKDVKSGKPRSNTLR